MIPFYSYSPEELDDRPDASSYFHQRPHTSAATQNSAFSLGNLHHFDQPDPNVPFHSPIYSHSAPPTPYQDQVSTDLHRQLLSPPQPSNSAYHSLYYHQASTHVYDQSNSLIRFDEPPPIASTSSSVYPQTQQAPETEGPPLLSQSLPLLTRHRRSLDEDSETGQELERKSKGKRGKRASISSSSRSDSRSANPVRTSRSRPDSVVEAAAVEKADKSCKACRGRKVRCSRDWPKCLRCVEKSLSCSYGDLVPVSFLNNDKLEEKIRALEDELISSRTPCAADFPTFLARILANPASPDESPGQDLDLRGKTLIRSHLAAFSAAHGYHPSFRSVLRSIHSFDTDLDSLSPHDQVTVSLCCALAHKSATSRNKAQGIDAPCIASALVEVAMDIYDQGKLGYEESTTDGLALHVLGSAILSADYRTRKESRGWLRIALSMYRDLIDSVDGFESSVRLQKEYGLVLLDIDSTLAVHFGTSPLISNADLALYFSTFPRTTSTSSLSAELSPFSAHSRNDDGSDGARSIDEGIDVIYRWVVMCVRWVAQQACPKGLRQSVSSSAVGTILSHVAQVHSAIANVQSHLVQVPASSGDQRHGGVEPLLRFLSRLNHQVDTTVFRCYMLVERRLAKPTEGAFHDFGAEALRSIKDVVIGGLKRAAFYFRVFTVSSSLDECRYLSLALAAFPSWVRLAVEQTFPAASNRNQLGLDFPGSRQGLSGTELDWIEMGLEYAAQQEVGLEEVLVELRRSRRGQGGGSDKTSSLRRPENDLGSLNLTEAISRVSNELTWI